MTQRNNFIYSQLSAETVCQLIQSHYEIIIPRQCKFYLTGLHDNYLVYGDAADYILRIYRNDWRSHEEVNFELELLHFLEAQHAAVATPLVTSNGELAFSIDCPEGNRLAALFRYADGDAPQNNLTIEQSKLLGSSVATLHGLTDSFSTNCQRPVLDADYLVDESIKTIKPFLEPDGIRFIDRLHKYLRNHWPQIPGQSATYGICHGDVNSRNFHINLNQKITLFDFDQCGFGYRAFEIGKFASSLMNNDQKKPLVNAFLEGYQEIRKLQTVELESVDYFQLVAIVWVMSIHASNADRIGYRYLERNYWDSKLQLLKELEHSHTESGFEAPDS